MSARNAMNWLRNALSSLFRFARRSAVKRDTRTRISELLVVEASDALKPGEGHLAADAEFSGLILSRSDRFRISGECTGELRQLRRGASIVISDTAKVNGKIVSTNVEINGEVIGEIDSKSVSVSKGGVIQGVVEYETLQLRGQLKHAELRPKEFWNKEKPKGVTHI